ncbi:SinI family restriction endonuclease [Asticcacaulis sp. EMRT-3]|uniref:SinI family restriction endonuclease n=1 Tax=Asticcacaulis sp. EMRT-3 TaxID=3040349 RepID=UPI0024AFEDF9|nr:SinI family restriction endonuclease [Asticcacaulis sp. EMRT-3]MDI7776340.1 SinI family restriction endonuclease [Asticcacaulis sp. EMRT-3]
MGFDPDCEAIARTAMLEIKPDLADRYVGLIRFLAAYPETASRRGKVEVGSAKYIKLRAKSFAESRNPKAPSFPATVPDKMASVILENFFGVPSENLERAKQEHLLSMSAENFVGYLLERYLASVMEPLGWIWCSGEMVKAADFIKPEADNKTWRLLQVKNRDNSENSSSSAIRNGTIIEKWFRTFSRTGMTNWQGFPCEVTAPALSENGFETFVRHYLDALKI